MSAALQRACIVLLQEANAQGPPIRLSRIARHLGASIEYDNHVPIRNEEASLRFVNGKIVLWVSRDKFENYTTRKRARFSIAHEIAHLMLYRMLGTKVLDCSNNSRQSYLYVERLCDIAGSHILIPRSALLKQLRKSGLTSAGFGQLLDQFDVSESALFRAIVDLTPRGSIIEWRKYRRHSVEPLVWRVWNTWRPAMGRDLSSWLPKGCTLKHVVGVEDPSSVSTDNPVTYPRVKLCLNKSIVVRDSIAVRWPSRVCQAQCALPDLPSEARKYPANHDLESGRYIMVFGAPNQLDLGQFPTKGALSQ